MRWQENCIYYFSLCLKGRRPPVLEEEILEMPVDFEKEKKKNIRLAIGVASLGVAGFFVVYIFSFLIMIYSPGWFFNLFPFPSFSESVVGFKGNLFLFSNSSVPTFELKRIVTL